jgi:outer membrane protein TolC
MKILSLVLFICLAIQAGFVFSQEVEKVTLDLLIEEALKSNPQIQSLKKQWQAKQAKVVSEGSLPQPQAQFTYFGESVQTKVGPQDKKYGLSQKIPFPTKLYLRAKIASKQSEIAYTRYILGIRELIMDLKTVFYDYYFILQSLKILEEEKLILESMHKAVQRKVEGLKSPQQDLVKVDLEIAGLDERMLALEKQENLLRAQINKLLNWPQDKVFSLPPDYGPTINLIEAQKIALLEKSLSDSPLVLLDKLGLESQEFRLSLARQEYIPDFGLMADYIDIGEGTTNLANDGEDAWMVGLSVTLPLWFWKINSDIETEKLKLDAQEDSLEEKENFLSFKVEDLYFKLNTNYQLIDLYQNVILPQAQQNFSTSRVSYEQGQVDFLNWLDAERNLIKVKLATVKQVVEYKKIIAQLEYIVGQDLE